MFNTQIAIQEVEIAIAAVVTVILAVEIAIQVAVTVELELEELVLDMDGVASHMLQVIGAAIYITLTILVQVETLTTHV